MFTIQILHRIEYVHSKNLIHRDIKPENFLIGEPDKYMIYIIDFGLSKKYRSSRTNKHIQFKLTKKFTGTARYASINAVRGAEQSRRDDLEAIGYMIMYFFNKGKLPWQGVSCKEKAHKYAKIYNLKKNLDYNIFCKDMPEEIIDYMNYCKELPFEKDPDYEYLRNLFENVLKRKKFINDLKFIWIKDYSILKNLKNSEEIKNKIFQLNLSKRKASPRSRIYKQLESAREINKENYIKTDINIDNSNNNTSNTLINNKSQVNLLNNNPIIKAKTYNLQDIQHKKYNSSWDIKGLKSKENDKNKSSIAKYNSSIEDESPFNNLSNINENYFGENNDNNNSNNNNTLNLKYIYSKNNRNISNNDSLQNNYYSNNNLFYFSNNFNINQNDFSKSLVLKNNINENNLNVNEKIDKEKTHKINYSVTNLLKNGNNNLNNSNNNDNSPNLIKSLSYVKKFKNEIEEIKINFGPKKNINKHIRNNNGNINNITNPINEKKVNSNMIRSNINNIVYNKKKGNKRKINDIKKLSINKIINTNNIVKKSLNPILVNKNKNLVNSKTKNRKILENDDRKIKKVKIIKPKNQNYIIRISPTNMNSKSYINVFKKKTFTNNIEQNTEPILTQNKINNSKFKRQHLKTNNLSPNFTNNMEGKINKIKSIQIHSNIKKDNNYNSNIRHKKLNTEIVFKTNPNDKMELNYKRINKYKNLRHKVNTKSGNLTIQKNDITNIFKGIPKPHVIHKTINSTINNSNNTITNTIHSNNNNNTIISIYNNYNINKNSSKNVKYKEIPRINFDYLNNSNNGSNNSNNSNKYLSYNGYKLNNYNNYVLINQIKSPTIISKQKNFFNFDNYQSIIPKIAHKSPNIYEKNKIANNYSYQDNYENSNLKNYFSIKGNDIPKNENKKNKIMNLSSFRQNLNALKIKKILTEMKYNNSKDNILNKKEKKIMDKNNIGNFFKNRSNSFVYGQKVNYQSLISKNKKEEIDFRYNYPTINRKKTDIFYQKLPKFKMNFDFDDSNLIEDYKNNTPSFKRHEQNRNYFGNYPNENGFFSPKY